MVLTVNLKMGNDFKEFTFSRSCMSSPSRNLTGFSWRRWSSRKVCGSASEATMHRWASSRACDAFSVV